MTCRNEKAYELAQEWVTWLDTRRFYGPPEQRSILAQFMPSVSKAPPNANNSTEIHAFNLAVCALPVGELVPFIAIYCGLRPKPIKCMADDIGIERAAFYERAHASAGSVMKTTRTLVELSEAMKREVFG